MYDIKNLAKLKLLDEKNQETMKAFWAFDKATFAPGAIDVQFNAVSTLRRKGDGD
jgi:hypothetical protein